MSIHPRNTILALALCLVAAPCAWASNDADNAFQTGQRLLAEGDTRAALKSYIEAVKLDRDNQDYLQQYLLVRRVVSLQAALVKEADPQQWEITALALRTFFASQGLHAQALPVDRAIFQRLKTADAAVQLADTLLALKRDEEATNVLATLDAQKTTTASQALTAVALMRQGKVDEAKRIQARITLTADADPGTLYLAARMHAAIGDPAPALATLTRCFESVPPSRLGDLKSHAKLCSDFTSLVSQPSFDKVMQTASKVAESQCSGGSSCSTCPLRGKCNTK